MQQSLQLNPSEIQMMEEVFQVFLKYADKTRKFGLHLVHSHFAVQENEILYETHNMKERSLKIVPMSKKKFRKLPLATSWQKNESGKIKVAMFCCEDVGDIDIPTENEPL